MYVSPNFQTKKALKDAVKAGRTVEVFSPGPYPCPQEGVVAVEGPYGFHKWYAQVVVEAGVVKKVK